jgi:hypothetical protein
MKVAMHGNQPLKNLLFKKKGKNEKNNCIVRVISNREKTCWLCSGLLEFFGIDLK